MDIDVETSGASAPRPAATSGAGSTAGECGTGGPAADVQTSAQAVDGYAADGEATAADNEASGRSSAPRRGKRGKQKSYGARQRQAALKAREAGHGHEDGCE